MHIKLISPRAFINFVLVLAIFLSNTFFSVAKANTNTNDIDQKFQTLCSEVQDWDPSGGELHVEDKPLEWLVYLSGLSLTANTLSIAFTESSKVKDALELEYIRKHTRHALFGIVSNYNFGEQMMSTLELEGASSIIDKVELQQNKLKGSFQELLDAAGVEKIQMEKSKKIIETIEEFANYIDPKYLDAIGAAGDTISIIVNADRAYDNIGNGKYADSFNNSIEVTLGGASLYGLFANEPRVALIATILAAGKFVIDLAHAELMQIFTWDELLEAKDLLDEYFGLLVVNSFCSIDNEVVKFTLAKYAEGVIARDDDIDYELNKIVDRVYDKATPEIQNRLDNFDQMFGDIYGQVNYRNRLMNVYDTNVKYELYDYARKFFDRYKNKLVKESGWWLFEPGVSDDSLQSDSLSAAYSLATIINFYYPKANLNADEVYHSGIQNYSYLGPADSYSNISFEPGATLPQYYKGLNSYPSIEKISKYLNNIWNINLRNINQASFINEAIERGPLLAKLEINSKSYYVVIGGVNNKGTESLEDDSYYIYDYSGLTKAFEEESLGGGQSKPYYQIAYDSFIGDAGLLEEAYELVVSDSFAARKFTVVADSSSIQLGSQQGESWEFVYDNGADWYYSNKEASSATLTPELSIAGYYKVIAKFRVDDSVSIKTAKADYQLLRDGNESLLKSVSVYSDTPKRQNEVISEQLRLEPGDKIQITNLPKGANVDAVKFEYIGDSGDDQSIPQTKFSDVKGSDWYCAYVQTLSANDDLEKNIIRGYPDGTFRPDQPINRIETFAMIYRAMRDRGLYDSVPAYSSIPYNDIDYKQWYAESLAWASETVNELSWWGSADGLPRDKYVSFFSEAKLNPTQNVTRDDVAHMIANALGFNVPVLTQLNENNFFTDIECVDEGADCDKFSGNKPWVRAIATKKIMSGYQDKTFGFRKLINRAEMAKVICEAFDYDCQCRL